MKRSLISLVLIAAATVSLASCRSLTPAITVNDVEISMDDFEEDLRALAASDVLASNQLVVDGRAEPELVAQWATLLVLGELVREENTRRGIVVTDDDLAAARDPALEDFLAELPDDMADRFVANQAQFRVLEAAVESDGGVAAVQQQLVDAAEVHVDARYGLVWDAALPAMVVAEHAPVPAERQRAD